MRAIDQLLVDEVWREMTSYPPGRQENEAREFLERQPHVATFCQVVTTEFDPTVQKAALGLTFLLFKILEASLGGPFPPVAEHRIREAYETTTEWLEQWEGADPRIFLRHVQGGGALPQPNLIQYLLAAFYGGDPASVDYDQEVKASLFLLLKTLADALDIGEVEPGERGQR
ncbi:MAG: hypothetical protein HY725_22715 [Candidatus Rokubacteria bacterium]|nr:hypothetical protein [Candidatus Rokubacteria bacterium]